MMRPVLAIAAAAGLALAACGGGGGGKGGLPMLTPRPPGPSVETPDAAQQRAQREALGLALDAARAAMAGLSPDSGADGLTAADAAIEGLQARIAEAYRLPDAEIAEARAELDRFQGRLAAIDYARIRGQTMAGLGSGRHSAVGLTPSDGRLSITYAGETLTVSESGTRLPSFGEWSGLDYRQRVDGADIHAVVYRNPFPSTLLDENYMRFGWWSRDDRTGVDVFPFYSPAGAARPTDREIWDRDRGDYGDPGSMLTWRGAATGKVAVRDTDTPANDLVGTFTAKVELTVAADHDISGSVTDFVVSDVRRGQVDRDWTVTLPATPLHGQPGVPGDATFGSPGDRPTWTGAGFGSSPTASDDAFWGGGIFESDPAPRETIEVTTAIVDDEGNETEVTTTLSLPTDRGDVAAGVFSTGSTSADETVTGRMTGAFGAGRQ